MRRRRGIVQKEVVTRPKSPKTLALIEHQAKTFLEKQRAEFVNSIVAQSNYQCDSVRNAIMSRG